MSEEINKEEMISKLYSAKDIISTVWEITNIDEVGDILCSIDEAIGAIEEKGK